MVMSRPSMSPSRIMNAAAAIEAMPPPTSTALRPSRPAPGGPASGMPALTAAPMLKPFRGKSRPGKSRAFPARLDAA